MVFNSYSFIAFAVVVFIVWYALPGWKARKVFLLLASYAFYSVWNPPFTLLLIFSTVVDFIAAQAMTKSEDPKKRKAWLVVSLVSQLGILGVFKYGDFLVRSFQSVAHGVGIEFQPVHLGLLLPIGISFYTFETLSYTIDVYRRVMPNTKSFLDYALYVTFFPHLVAGPIVRAADFIPQFAEPKKFDGKSFAWGATLFLIGLAQKSVLADGLFAPVAERLYSGIGSPTFLDAWIGTFAFAGQIFCDFAGYSTCAIGVALCLGFVLPINFRYPYGAIGFSDFWRRWHISLSTWLRDYLYISLGGNRRGPTRTQINLMLTMLLGGLWHGASWTFVAWGGLHGLYLIGERWVRALVPETLAGRTPVRMLGALATFLLVCLTWVFFRADTFHEAYTILGAMVHLGGGVRMVQRYDVPMTLILIAALVSYHWWMRERTLPDVVARLRWPIRAVAFACLGIAIFNMSGDDRAFIYFQF